MNPLFIYPSFDSSDGTNKEHFMKVMDIKPRPLTNLEHFDVWRNHTQAKFVEITGKRIEVIKIDDSKLSEAKEALCKAYGHYKCVCGKDQ